MPETRQTRIIGYALNCFPYHTLDEMWACLQSDVLAIKERVFPGEVFPIELRFSECIVRELTSDGHGVVRLKDFLASHGLTVVTINGFVMPAFHGEPVKERVYLPAWHESGARLQFTNDCLDLLARLAQQASVILSVSVPFGALKPVTMADVAPNILRCGEHAARLHRSSGVPCMVALEPEPGLCVETTAEAIAFFQQYVPGALRPYIGVNFDLAHQLVQFEDLLKAVAALTDSGITIAKVHVTNAAEFTEFRLFYHDSIYLHQVVGVNQNAEPAFFSLDWPSDCPPSNLARFRCHYHLPVCDTPDLPVGTTLDEVARFLVANRLPARVPHIIETYTWPERLRGRDHMVENICRELAWVRDKIGLSGCKDSL